MKRYVTLKKRNAVKNAQYFFPDLRGLCFEVICEIRMRAWRETIKVFQLHGFMDAMGWNCASMFQCCVWLSKLNVCTFRKTMRLSTDCNSDGLRTVGLWYPKIKMCKVQILWFRMCCFTVTVQWRTDCRKRRHLFCPISCMMNRPRTLFSLLRFTLWSLKIKKSHVKWYMCIYTNINVGDFRETGFYIMIVIDFRCLRTSTSIIIFVPRRLTIMMGVVFFVDMQIRITGSRTLYTNFNV